MFLHNIFITLLSLFFPPSLSIPNDLLDRWWSKMDDTYLYNVEAIACISFLFFHYINIKPIHPCFASLLVLVSHMCVRFFKKSEKKLACLLISPSKQTSQGKKSFFVQVTIKPDMMDIKKYIRTHDNTLTISCG